VKIFAYWDKPNSIPAYLQLCLATWQAYGGIDKVCLITDANLNDWIAEGTLDVQALQQYPVAQRKDAIEIAVLARYGGLFLDVDTICTASPSAIIQALEGSEIALYGFHLAVVAARPDSEITSRWLELLQQTLTVPREQLIASCGNSHFMLGNYTFGLLRDELATGKPAVPGELNTRPGELIKKIRRHWVLKTKGRHLISQINPRKSGFIAEQDYCGKEKLNAVEGYKNFWFSEKLPICVASNNGGSLIGLHHTWTPARYSAMGFEELAEDQALLSRVLKELLQHSDISAFDVFKEFNPIVAPG